MLGPSVQSLEKLSDSGVFWAPNNKKSSRSIGQTLKQDSCHLREFKESHKKGICICSAVRNSLK